MKIKLFLKKICPNFIISFYKDLLYRKDFRLISKKNRQLFYNTKLHYQEVEKRIINRNNKIIKFASYVIFDSTFCAYGLMDLMLSNPNKYLAKIVVIPDVSRGDVHMKKQYNKTKNFFINKYGLENVLDGYDFSSNKFIDLSDTFDIIYCANPYDNMVNKIHSIKYLSTKNCLPIYISYGCYVDKYSCYMVFPLLELSLMWKVFADNKYSFKDYKKYELVRGKNVLLTGYSKMDELEKYKNITKSYKKTIIISPHHTINMPTLPLSNFMNNYEFILKLPQMYPQIHFIFRPHPLLFTNLVNEGYWTEQQVEDYINKLKTLGVEYSFGGDYLELFMQADGIIHDCASFIVEFLYTNKPCCFFAKENYKNILSKLGNACLKYYYISYNQEEICNFIENIILKNSDPLAQKRQRFVNKKIALNYPNVSKIILDNISL